MDVQTENTDPPPCESQPSGKIRKGFKLFGKRKPGNIFSIRSKSEGNNKSPVSRSKTLDGASESAAPDSEQDPEKEKAQIQRDGEQTEEEPLGEDGVLAVAPARTSISSASSAKSLGFLSILRGGRRGAGDRRVHTVSQPVGRQRRGIKGLFGNVKFLSKDKNEKGEKEDIPPSPLLMSSRSNSVEIIKEDLTLTPKSQPRSLDSPETESSEPTKSLTQDSSATSPSKTVTLGSLTKMNESQSTTQASMVPGETSLSTLLADISSLLTFDSISGGGDIMADVEAEWGKASSAMSAVVSDASPSSTSPFPKPTVLTPLTTSSISATLTAKPPTTSILTTQSSSTIPSSPLKPSSIITTLTKSSTLITPTIKPTTGSSLEPAVTTSTKPSTTSLTNISAPIMSPPPITMKTTLGFSTSTTTTAPPNTPATATKAPSASPTLTSTVNKLASEMTETPKTTASVSKPSSVAAPPPALTKTTPLTHSPITPAPFTLSSSTKPDLTSSLQSASLNKVPVTVSVTSPISAQPSPSVPLISSKMTRTEVTSALVSVSTTSITTPAPTLCTADLNRTSPSIVSGISSSAALTKSQPSVVSVPSMTSSMSQAPPTPASTAPVYLNGTLPAQKIPPATTSIPAPVITHISQSPPAYVSKEPLSVSQPKLSAAPPPSLSKGPIQGTQITSSLPQIPPASSHPALSQTTSCPVSSSPLSQDGLSKKKESDRASVDGNLISPKSPEARDILQQYSQQIKEDKKRTSQGHTTGLSKIPIVGGGRAGKIPVRVSQHSEEETNRDVAMTFPEEATPHLNSHDMGSKDKITHSEVVVTSKHSQEEIQQQPKAPTCSPRDSKIPVKHGSQIPQAKDPTRTKIPVSKVPVRRAGAKPTALSSSTQIRK